MTASLVIEVGVLSLASVLGVRKLYEMETNANRWPDSTVAFGMLLVWGCLSVLSLYSAMMTSRGAEPPTAKWILLAVVASAFLTHALQTAGLLQSGVGHDEQKRDAASAVFAVRASLGQNSGQRPGAPRNVVKRVDEVKLEAVRTVAHHRDRDRSIFASND